MRLTSTWSGSRLTPEEDDLIVEVVELGMKAEEIAQSLERSTKSIYYRMKRLKRLNRLDLALWEDITTEHFPERGSISVQRAYERYQVRKQIKNEQEE